MPSQKQLLICNFSNIKSIVRKKMLEFRDKQCLIGKHVFKSTTYDYDQIWKNMHLNKQNFSF